MKKLAFLIATIICGFTTFAQQVNLNNGVNINIPRKLKKITKEQALAHANKRFNNNKKLLNFYANSDTHNEFLYRVDDIVIAIKAFDTTYKFKEGHAEDLKRGLDEMARGAQTYTSILKKINNNSIVITNYIIGEAGYYRFYCFNANNTRTISGRIVFVKADKDKATAILDNILNSIKFKD